MHYLLRFEELKKNDWEVEGVARTLYLAKVGVVSQLRVLPFIMSWAGSRKLFWSDDVQVFKYTRHVMTLLELRNEV
jgi:hypothetical protein